MKVVVDASALIAGLRGEPGAERVDAAIRDAVISSVNLAEVVGVLALAGAKADEIDRTLALWSLAVISPDQSTATEVGLMRPLTEVAGLSLGDRFCLALARRINAPVLTADRAWAKIAAEVGVTIELIR